MRKLICFALFVCGTAHAQTAAPLTYVADDGSQATPAVTTPLVDGTPAIPTYQDALGQLKSPVVTVSVCSVDASGVPLLCPQGITQTAADARYAQLSGAVFGGAITAPSLTVGSSTAAGTGLYYNGTSKAYRVLTYQSAGASRFAMGLFPGDDFYAVAYPDAGGVNTIFSVNHNTGLIALNQLVQMVPMTHAAIMALTNVLEGSLANDATNHALLVYENGSWWQLNATQVTQ